MRKIDKTKLIFNELEELLRYYPIDKIRLNDEENEKRNAEELDLYKRAIYTRLYWKFLLKQMISEEKSIKEITTRELADICHKYDN